MSLRGYKSVSVAVAAALTATSQSAAVDILGLDGDARFVLDASATGGAGQTLDVKIQHSADGQAFTDSGVTFTQVKNTGPLHETVGVNINDLKRYIRAVSTVAGASATVTRSVSLVAKVKNGY